MIPWWAYLALPAWGAAVYGITGLVMRRRPPITDYHQEDTMARLPSERYVMQQSDGTVRLFEDGPEREIVCFDPADANATAIAQGTIHGSELGEEDQAFAHFWSGYFYAHASDGRELPPIPEYHLADPASRQAREHAAARFAEQLGLDPAELIAGADAAWSNLNPQSARYESALSVAAVVLRAARRGPAS